MTDAGETLQQIAWGLDARKASRSGTPSGTSKSYGAPHRRGRHGRSLHHGHEDRRGARCRRSAPPRRETRRDRRPRPRRKRDDPWIAQTGRDNAAGAPSHRLLPRPLRGDDPDLRGPSRDTSHRRAGRPTRARPACARPRDPRRGGDRKGGSRGGRRVAGPRWRSGSGTAPATTSPRPSRAPPSRASLRLRSRRRPPRRPSGAGGTASGSGLGTRGTAQAHPVRASPGSVHGRGGPLRHWRRGPWLGSAGGDARRLAPSGTAAETRGTVSCLDQDPARGSRDRRDRRPRSCEPRRSSRIATSRSASHAAVSATSSPGTTPNGAFPRTSTFPSSWTRH